MKRTFALLLTALLLVAACTSDGDGDGDGDADGGGADGAEDGGSLTVYAVGSLEPDLQALAEAFEAETPGTTIEFTFGSGSELVDQLTGGAEADLFIGTAGNVADLNDEGLLVGDAVPLGSDQMEIVVPTGNPAGVAGLDAFGDNPAVNSGLCNADVSCGEFANAILAAAGIAPAPDSVEPTAGDLVRKLADAQLDAGMLWRTQAASRANAVDLVAIPQDVNRVTNFEVGQLTTSSDAEAFLSWLDTPAAQDVLVARGLQPE